MKDVIDQLKHIINQNNAQLTIDERNLLSVAYKNLTANLRSSWRTIDALQKKEALSSTRQQVKLMRVEKDEIERDLDRLCRDLCGLLEHRLIPAATDGEEKVFYCKMYVVPRVLYVMRRLLHNQNAHRHAPSSQARRLLPLSSRADAHQFARGARQDLARGVQTCIPARDRDAPADAPDASRARAQLRGVLPRHHAQPRACMPPREARVRRSSGSRRCGGPGFRSQPGGRTDDPATHAG